MDGTPTGMPPLSSSSGGVPVMRVAVMQSTRDDCTENREVETEGL